MGSGESERDNANAREREREETAEIDEENSHSAAATRADARVTRADKGRERDLRKEIDGGGRARKIMQSWDNLSPQQWRRKTKPHQVWSLQWAVFDECVVHSSEPT